MMASCYRPLCRYGAALAMRRRACKPLALTRRAVHATPCLSSDGSDAPSSTQQRRRLDVAIVGAPNAGKSQLLNSLVGLKVAAVSRKRHTTRTGILGARTVDDTQLVFIDTPGFLHHGMGAKEGVRKLLGEASAEMECADFTLLVVDAARKLDEDMKRTLVTLMFLALRSRGRNEGAVGTAKTSESVNQVSLLNKFAVVVNKVDLVKPKEKLLVVASNVGAMAEGCIRRLLQQKRNPSRVRLGDLVDSVLEKYEEEEGLDNVHEDDYGIFAEVAPEFLFTAAIDEDDEGVDDVLNLLLERATPSKHWLVDAESTTGMTPIEQVEEIVREKIYRCLHREVPHAVQQQNKMFRLVEPEGEDDLGSDDSQRAKVLIIHQDLVVKTKSHQKLVMGSGGKTLERIRSTALRDLEEAFQCAVDLRMNVRILKSKNREVSLEGGSEGASSFTM
ncbi:hypothetical protein ACHAXT_006889 [Thalassiosira profunda]